MERGIWSKSDQEPDSNDEESDPIAESPRRIERVVPFVEDRRNVLVLTPQPALIPAVMLSLQYALKRGIEARYQLEESELAAEPLPTDAEPSQFLFYEAAEGGAGVLVRLAEEPQALAEVAREALRLCQADASFFYQRDGDHVIVDATAGTGPKRSPVVGTRQQIEEVGIVRLAFETRRAVHMADGRSEGARLLVAPDVRPEDWAERWPDQAQRSRLAVPVLYEGESIGVIRGQRVEPAVRRGRAPAPGRLRRSLGRMRSQ